MNREEYLEQLKRHLKKLPKEEYDNAIEYFTEYFEEAGKEKEAQVIEELGTPKEAASELLNHLLDEKVTEVGEKKKGSSVWKGILIAILALFAAPIGLPLAFAGIVIVLALVFTVVVLILSLILFEVVLVVLSGSLVVQGIGAITHSISGFCVIAGTGLLGIGAGILLALFTVFVCRLILKGMFAFVQWITRKRGAKS